jgi:hypothetical protein
MQMSYRVAKFASAILASVLANVALPAISYGATPAADDCLTGPKDPTPQGSHWFYRIERGTKRHCWYLKDASDKVSQAAPANSPPVANPAPPSREPTSAPVANPAPSSRETTAQRSLADAYAELPLPQTRFDPPPAASPAQSMAVPPANAASPDSNQPATAQDANQQTSLIASRWPDPSNVNAASPSDVSASADPQPAADNSDANAEANVMAAPPAAATVPAVTADVSSVKQPVPMQTLLLVVVGALALAGLIASVVVRFGSRRRRNRQKLRGSQRINWDLVAADRPSPSNYPAPQARMPRAGIPRELRAANDAYARMAHDRIADDFADSRIADDRVADDRVEDDRITEMLARLARSSMN